MTPDFDARMTLRSREFARYERGSAFLSSLQWSDDELRRMAERVEGIHERLAAYQLREHWRKQKGCRPL